MDLLRKEDVQRVKTVDNADVWEITLALDPAP
jgi:hypothetical protein